MTKMNLKNVLFLILRIVFLTFISALTALPFIWMVCSALKPSAEVMESASFLPSQIEYIYRDYYFQYSFNVWCFPFKTRFYANTKKPC